MQLVALLTTGNVVNFDSYQRVLWPTSRFGQVCCLFAKYFSVKLLSAHQYRDLHFLVHRFGLTSVPFALSNLQSCEVTLCASNCTGGSRLAHFPYRCGFQK